MSKEIVWSEYQKAIFAEVKNGNSNCLITARAGSGKTKTLLETLKYIDPKRKILVVAFNKKIATELQERAPSYSNLEICTLHSFGYRMIRQALGKVKLDTEKAFKIIQKLLASRKNNPKDRDDYETIFEMKKCVSLCKGLIIDTPTKIDDLMDEFDISAGSLEREDFIQTVILALGECKKKKDIVDFDDMLWLVFCLNIPIDKFDEVLIDEVQDLNPIQVFIALNAAKKDGRIMAYGDGFQCVDKDTVLSLADGLTKSAEDIQVGEKILSWRNGIACFKTVTAKKLSTWESGIKIITKSGKSITMSPNHKIWAEKFELGGEHLVYLMYRSDLGFRVGITNKWKSAQNALGNRARSEGADKMWILDLAPNESEARFLEESYSLTFGVPTMVFAAKERGLDEVRMKRLFDAFGQNGFKLLSHKNYEFDYPHWHQRSCFTPNKKRSLINVHAHIFKTSAPNKKGKTRLVGGTTVNLEFSDLATKKVVDVFGLTYKTYVGSNAENTHYSIRRYYSSYEKAISLAKALGAKIGSAVSEHLFVNPREEFKLITASGLHIGMKVPVLDGQYLISDEIVSIEKIDGQFYDLSIEDTQNFFGNGILSHNSIYQFRGIESDTITSLQKKLNAKILPLPISYRCPKKVIFEAQRLVPDITYAPGAKDGNIVNILEKDIVLLVKPNDFVLSRTNAPLVKLCFQLWKHKIPASIKGKDLGPALLGLIAQSKKKNVKSFIIWLNEWANEEILRLKKKNRKPNTIIDRVECLTFLAEGKDKIVDLVNSIKSLFENKDGEGVVGLGTVHFYKGAEANRVFFLTKTMVFGDSQEEKNIQYVAITRAKDTLFYVR